MTEPLPLQHPRLPGLGRSDFVVSPGNAVALAMIDGWQNWPSGKLLLTGPRGSGKTHLAHIWAQAAGARMIAARDLTDQIAPELAHSPVVVEDVDRIGDRSAEEGLFHLHNLMRENGHPLLMTGAPGVAGWALTLPDLRSRIQGAQSATLDLPDDGLLTALLAKSFGERQLNVPPNVLSYLVRHMDRSFETARRVVDDLDRQSLLERRAITVRMAREVLDNLPPDAS
ncbi:HdaA/DnaA family protein [Pseudooceanicola sp. MF1-13]|uniref:HdaA/DnaA family protein n=1 Tax=Pseudooceanicola sp. MF1-13 TaxID=3379095 RepID=UPI003891BCFB